MAQRVIPWVFPQRRRAGNSLGFPLTDTAPADYIDGARLSRVASTPAATTTSIPRDDSNQIKYSITDANGHDADGALAANPKNGDLSLTRKRGG